MNTWEVFQLGNMLDYRKFLGCCFFLIFIISGSVMKASQLILLICTSLHAYCNIQYVCPGENIWESEPMIHVGVVIWSFLYNLIGMEYSMYSELFDSYIIQSCLSLLFPFTFPNKKLVFFCSGNNTMFICPHSSDDRYGLSFLKT